MPGKAAVTITSNSTTHSAQSTMNAACVRHDEITEQYVNGRLTEQDRAAFEAHYFECGRCFAELKAYQLVQEELAKTAASHSQRASAGASRTTRSWTWLAAMPVGVFGLSIWKHWSGWIKRHMGRTIVRPQIGQQSVSSDRDRVRHGAGGAGDSRK